ncbi:MAG: HEAT repeat domain-containing protein, partial [Planctomycetes bacterium]|nr:HEAT repeat domain-containing protein [Planctomycetota bacterium]
MTGLRRTMGFVFALAAFQAPLWAAHLDEVADTFKQGVDQWQRGHEKEALEKFRQVLAGSPSQESAYALWTDPEIEFSVWRELLAAGGETELLAKRLIELARLERKARANDADAIKALVAQITGTGDAKARWPAIQKLSADHGEYGAAYLVNFLTSEMSDSDKRSAAAYALIRMNTDVVVPLCAALASDDAVLRGNLSLVLGTIKDPRARGYLAWMAANDPDGTVKEKAKQALDGAGWSGTDPVKAFLASGEHYHFRRMRDEDYSDVIWRWDGKQLAATPIPRAVYNDEMAKIAYDTALQADPASTEALAGLARSYVAQAAKLEAMEKSGADLGAWKGKIDEARLARNAAGVPALDLALQWCVNSNDSSTGAALCRVLGSLCKDSTAGLQAALASSDGAMRSEAAVALSMTGMRAGSAPNAAVVGLLGEAVGRDVVRLAFV